MDFDAGQTMELQFIQKISHHITWKAPLAISVSYI